MSVYDQKGDKIGTVKEIYLGAVSATDDERGLGPATPSAPGSMDKTPMRRFIDAVSPNQPVPEPLRQRLLRHGFIRIDTSGLLTADRYATPDQIAGVTDDRVELRVTRDDLVKR